MHRVHHLDCATLCTLAPRLVVGPGRAGLVCHCLLVEAPDGLVLVDTGIGLADIRDPARLGRGFGVVLRPRLDEARTAIRQVEALGYSVADVKHVVLTHLDADHAGGLSDFPKAKVHVAMQEHEAAMLRFGLREQRRYRPAHWEHWADFDVYRARGERWCGLDAIALRGLPDDILLVPLPGHTVGHSGVAVRTPAGWLLHAGDAYFHRARLTGGRVPLALRVVERYDDVDHDARVRSLGQVAAVARSGEARVFCSHDPVEFEAFAS